jgi:hypothetical protein
MRPHDRYWTIMRLPRQHLTWCGFGEGRSHPRAELHLVVSRITLAPIEPGEQPGQQQAEVDEHEADEERCANADSDQDIVHKCREHIGRKEKTFHGWSFSQGLSSAFQLAAES